MKIIDSWLHNGKTALFCTDLKEQDIKSKEVAIIGDKKYFIIGYDILISLTGITNIMILLNTTDNITYPQEFLII